MNNTYYKDGNMYTWGDSSAYQAYPGGIMGHGIGSFLSNPKLADAYLKQGFIKNLGPIGGQPQAPAPLQPSPMFANPFSTAMSGTQSGTLQPYINRNTQLANNALYGGLLNSQPQQLLAGDAGGTPVNPTPPQFNLPSALPQNGPLAEQDKPMFGNRAWMEY